METSTSSPSSLKIFKHCSSLQVWKSSSRNSEIGHSFRSLYSRVLTKWNSRLLNSVMNTQLSLFWEFRICLLTPNLFKLFLRTTESNFSLLWATMTGSGPWRSNQSMKSSRTSFGWPAWTSTPRRVSPSPDLSMLLTLEANGLISTVGTMYCQWKSVIVLLSSIKKKTYFMVLVSSLSINSTDWNDLYISVAVSLIEISRFQVIKNDHWNDWNDWNGNDWIGNAWNGCDFRHFQNWNYFTFLCQTELLRFSLNFWSS